jgi:hypothetical protein
MSFKKGLLCLSVAFGLAVASAAPARAADLCIQLDGVSCPLSGDLGFFRFKAKLPKNPKKAVALHGRVAGLGSAYGTAVMSNDATSIDIGVTFFADATQGQFNGSFDPTDLASVHSANADYGAYDVGGGSCDMTIVDCAGEPGLEP